MISRALHAYPRHGCICPPAPPGSSPTFPWTGQDDSRNRKCKRKTKNGLMQQKSAEDVDACSSTYIYLHSLSHGESHLQTHNRIPCHHLTPVSFASASASASHTETKNYSPNIIKADHALHRREPKTRRGKARQPDEPSGLSRDMLVNLPSTVHYLHHTSEKTHPNTLLLLLLLSFTKVPTVVCTSTVEG